MFSDGITTSDAFLDMPAESQLLYFHLGINADDDGFIANTKMVQRIIGASDDSLKILFAKKFLIAFENGICVVKHWRINNYIRKDIYKETKYIEQKRRLYIRENGAYSLRSDNAIPLPPGHFTLQDKFGKDVENEPSDTYVDDTSTERARSGDVGKVRKGKVRKGKDSKNKQKNGGDEIELPEWLDKKKWAEWMTYRKERKLTCSDITINKQIKLLEKNQDKHTEIIERSLLNGWQGLFPLPEVRQGKAPSNVLKPAEDKYSKYDK